MSLHIRDGEMSDKVHCLNVNVCRTKKTDPGKPREISQVHDSSSQTDEVFENFDDFSDLLANSYFIIFRKV